MSTHCKVVVFFLISTLSNGVAAGDIFRCIGANGDVMYTNMACPANSQVQHVASYNSVPDVPVPAYDIAANATAANTLEMREAALQAREAAYQAQAAYDQQQTEGGSDDTAYAAGWIPFYSYNRSHFHDRRRRPVHAMAAPRSTIHSLPAQTAVFLPRH